MAGSPTLRRAAPAAAAAAVALLLGPVPTAAAADPGAPLPTPHLLPLPANAAPLSSVYDLNNAGDILGETYLNIPNRFAPRALRWNAHRSGVTTLEPLPGEVATRPGSLNAAGVAVGVSFATLTDNHPVRWAADGTPTALELPAGARGGSASRINNAGVVIGGWYDSGYRSKPLKWQADGTRVDLPLLPGDGTGSASFINDAGFVIGWSSGSVGGESRTRTVVWSPSGDVTALPLPPGIDAAGVVRITNDGVILGQGRRAGGTEFDRVVAWDANGTARDVAYGRLSSVNNANTIAGTTFGADRSEHAARWTLDGTLTLLDAPAGRQAWASTINAAGTTVGFAEGPTPYRRTPVLWRPDGTAVPLPPSSLGPYARALLVNESGVIAGDATWYDAPNAQDLPRAMIWKP
ncbi:hypothetical protein ACIQOV_33870 [Kitasatospora sp. NPDC091257]|uniref:hypothetical protein n=1 Tax=Kitasatospora sp. NPDC091257 TaxID=3364084 RepID=UPI0038089240